MELWIHSNIVWYWYNTDYIIHYCSYEEFITVVKIIPLNNWLNISIIMIAFDGVIISLWTVVIDQCYDSTGK